MVDFRVTNGASRYTANFTPPAISFLTAGMTTYDPFWRDVTFMPRAAVGNTGTDVSGNALALTLTGMTTSATSHQEAEAWVFNGTTGYINVPVATAGNAAKFYGDFTVQTWINPTAWSAGAGILDTRTVYTNTTGIVIKATATSGQLVVSTGTTALITASVNVSLNVWSHVALVQQGQLMTLYINGTYAGSASSASGYTDGVIAIGAAMVSSSSYTAFFTGSMAGYAITNGIARYTGGFTPPATPFLTTGPT